MQIKIEENVYTENSNLFLRLRPALQMLSCKVVTAKNAARSCNLSCSHFMTLFKKSYGISFALYERTFRLNGAAGDIARGSSLKEAADKWGFCDKSHLARLLKKYNSKSSEKQ